VSIFPLDRSVPEVRRIVRRQFEANRGVGSLPLIDGLILQGTLDLIETRSVYKQRCHVMKYLDDVTEEEDRAEAAALLRLDRTAGPEAAQGKDRPVLRMTSAEALREEIEDAGPREEDVKRLEAGLEGLPAGSGTGTRPKGPPSTTSRTTSQPISPFLNHFLNGTTTSHY
jgi:hypothetical protein